MAATGLALLRRLAPTSSLGYMKSKLAENPSLSQHPHLDSPFGTLQISETIDRRYMCCHSALQSPAELAGKGSRSCKSRSGRKYEVDINAVEQKSSDTKSGRAPLWSLQASAAQGRGRRNSSENMGAGEDNAVEQKSFKVKPRSKSAETPQLHPRNEGETKASLGELTREADKPSAYVTSDFVDYRAMQLVFLGTSSSIPTWNRSTSCLALRVDGSIFLFDCGEGAVRQILKTPMKHYDISNIFITHMHGDHIYGLPGLLCRIGLKEFQSKHPIHVYGPQGLRQWVRSTLKASHARVHPKYTVHEMILKVTAPLRRLKMEINLTQELLKKPSNMAHSWNLVEENHNDELPGEDIERSSDGLWHIYTDDKYIVRASILRHTIPCWGYVVEEHARRGRFNVERALDAGVKPGRYFRMLETGSSITLASGKVVSPADVLGPCRRGRKVVILGDTCDSRSMVAAAQEADVVVHEATVLDQDASEVYQRGHSTAKMAGEFARTINAGTLVLTHFSRKLDGALFVDEKSHVRTTLKDLVCSAQKTFGKDSVIAAEDLMAITIQLADKPPVPPPVQHVNK